MFLNPTQYLHFISLWHRSIEIYTVQKCSSAFFGSGKYEYGNLNSFKNRYQWTSVEMFPRRFSTAFRIASIKNTHRWLLAKCSFAENSQGIYEKPTWWSPLKVKLPKHLKNSYFPKRALCVSLPFGLRFTFIFPQEYRKVWITVGRRFQKF